MNISQNVYNTFRIVVIDIGDKENPLSPLNNNTVPTTNRKIEFALPKILKEKDIQLFDEYTALLYRFANIIAKANNEINADEENKLKEIYQSLHHNLPIFTEKEVAADVDNSLSNNPVESNSLEETMQELDSLVGLGNIKEEIRTLINFIKVQKARKEAGLDSSNISYHMVFTGNPGTGKTTVARLIGKIFKALGILSKGQLIETDRSGLVGEYIGHTAGKVNNKVNSAMNGVLFIDEAYALASEIKNDFGQEAIATLVKRMEDDRDKFVVILAGYTDEMKAFIEINPGFKSRINRYLEFPDYTPNELFEIFKSQCSKLDYHLTEEAVSKLKNIFDTAFRKRNKTFGNGRFVRNIFEKTLEKQANRIAGIAPLTKEILTTITADDVGENASLKIESSQNKMATGKNTFYLRVYDNSSNMDESTASNSIDYGTYEEALNAAKFIVEEFFKDKLNGDISADEILAQYDSYCENPVIISNKDGSVDDFSARNYAKKYVEEQTRK